MTISPELIQQVVRETVREVISRQDSGTDAPSGTDGIFTDMNSAVDAADVAWRQYMDCSLRDRNRFIQAIRDVASEPDNLEYMATATVEETGMGNVPHKILKNRYAALYTPGTEDIITEPGRVTTA